MTVLEVLKDCVGRLNGVRLPAAEAVNVIIISTVANDIQECINTLRAHADAGTAPEPESETPEETSDEEKAGEE